MMVMPQQSDFEREPDRHGLFESAPPLASVFDPELALKRCYSRPKMLAEMIDSFPAEVDSLFPQMRAALAKGDLPEVGRLGHRIKGTVACLGAERAREAAVRVEHFERHSSTAAEAEQAISALEQQCEALKSALATARAASRPPQSG